MHSAHLRLSDGSLWPCQVHVAHQSLPLQGEVVFTTSMVGYEQSMTDPSYSSQIITFTFPLIGNYGTPAIELDQFGLPLHHESEKIQCTAIIVSEPSEQMSHYLAESPLAQWLESSSVPLITGIDTRALTQHIREHGALPGEICLGEIPRTEPIQDPNTQNLVEKVSVSEPKVYEPLESNGQTLALIDYGVKAQTIREFLSHGFRVVRLPWSTSELPAEADRLFLSNGPGDPSLIAPTSTPLIQSALEKGIPISGICLGSQLLAHAIGATTYKLPYGHRGINQPALDLVTGKALLTTQNHGYAIEESSLPSRAKVRLRNLNDHSVEGIELTDAPALAVQFHPESTPGPRDARYFFSEFCQ